MFNGNPAVSADKPETEGSSKVVPIPDDYNCPITQELMEDPVVAADGRSYEHKAITRN